MCEECEASHMMGKRFAPNAVRNSNVLERTKRLLIPLLPLFNKLKRAHFQIQTHSGISRYAICNEAYPTATPTIILTKIMSNNTGGNFDCDPTFEASSFSSELLLLIQGDLKDFDPELTLSKNQAELSGSRVKCWHLLHQYTEICFFPNRENELKECLS